MVGFGQWGTLWAGVDRIMLMLSDGRPAVMVDTCMPARQLAQLGMEGQHAPRKMVVAVC